MFIEVFWLLYRDFATRNCLLASDLSVKVGDYGLSEEVFKVRQTTKDPSVRLLTSYLYVCGFRLNM